MRARLTIQLSALLGDQAAGRGTVNTTSRPAGPIYLITVPAPSTRPCKPTYELLMQNTLHWIRPMPGRPDDNRAERSRACSSRPNVVPGADLA